MFEVSLMRCFGFNEIVTKRVYVKLTGTGCCQEKWPQRLLPLTSHEDVECERSEECVWEARFVKSRVHNRAASVTPSSSRIVLFTTSSGAFLLGSGATPSSAFEMVSLAFLRTVKITR